MPETKDKAEQVLALIEALTEDRDALLQALYDRGYLPDAIVDLRSRPGPRGAARLVPLEGLRQIEWSRVVKVAPEGGLIQSCPACHEWKSAGHKPDCWLAKAKADAIRMQ